MTGKLTELQGDALKGAIEFHQQENKPVIIPHVCNDIGGWGSGFVVAINKSLGFGPKQAYQLWYKYAGAWSEESKEEFEKTQEAYGIAVKTIGPFKLDSVQFVKVKKAGVTVANMIAQHQVRGMDESGRPPIRYGALAIAMRVVASNVIQSENKPVIHCPRFGSELAGGNWEVIREMIQEIWIDAGIDVNVYEFI